MTVLLAGLAGASAQPYSRSASVVAGGGGSSANSQYSLSGTIGQPSAGIQSDGRFALYGGFWPGFTSSHVVIPEHRLVWTNTHGGKWSVASNWNPNQVPGAADTAVLDLRSTYTVTMDVSGTVANLTLGAGATLTGTNPLTVLGALTWTGGKLSARVQCSGGTVSGGETHTLSAGRLVNGGTLQLTAPITTAGATIITNLPGAVLDLAGDVGLTYSSGGYGAIINQGTLRKSDGTGVSQISEVITNTGTIETRSGTLELSRGCVQTGGATVVGEGQLQLGQGMLLAGGLLTGASLITGAITNSGGILAPGSSSGGLEIQGRYVQTAAGRLVIELGGPNPGTGFDVLTVNGVARLGGTLAVSFVNGFVPVADSSFEFLAAGSCSGAFGTFDPPLESLGLTLIYAPDHVTLRAGGPPQPEVLPPYTISDLGGLAGFGASAQAINNLGQVVGFSPVAGGTHAFLYDQGTILDLGTLAGPTSYAYGINEAGHVVGWSTTTAASAPVHAFYYDGTLHDLGTLGAANQSSYAYGINNHDEVVGHSALMVQGDSATHPFLYRHGAMIDLHSPFLPGNTVAGGFAYALNDQLHIVGNGPRPVGSAHGFLYDYVGGSVLDVGDLGGANGSVAQAVNSAGLVTGWAYIENNLWVHAYRFDGRIHDLGTLGGRNSHGLGINGHGQIVGRSEYEDANGTPHAFLYADGQMSDLNSVLPPNSEWTLREATDINDRGEIVGIATRRGAAGWRAFLLTPGSAAAPSLKIQLAPGDTLALVWSIENPNCRVQENPVLSPTGWAEVNVTPAVVGDEVQVVLPRPAGMRFYRLMQP